jgi:hypothetical protein
MADRWKLVPVEATEEMRDGLRVKLLVAPSYDLSDDSEVDGIWRELIAASPPPGEALAEDIIDAIAEFDLGTAEGHVAARRAIIAAMESS